MPQMPEHPTSLPKGPLRDCLERIQAEIVSEMNTAQSPPFGGHADIDVKQLSHWVNRLTEAIHFNGQVPEAITGVPNDGPAWPDLDNAMRELQLIGGQPLHASRALELLGRHRHKVYTELVKVGDLLERFADRFILSMELPIAHEAIKDARDRVMRNVLGLR